MLVEQSSIQFVISCLFTVSHQTASAVGFSVYADGDYHYPDEGEIIRFPLVFTNNGGHYNTSDSVFTCPINGTYYFIFNLNSGQLSNGERTSAYIQRDGDKLAEGNCRHYGPDNLSLLCGNSVVIHCHLGQRVFIATAYPDTQFRHYAKRSVFSGFLIHADIPPH